MSTVYSPVVNTSKSALVGALGETEFPLSLDLVIVSLDYLFEKVVCISTAFVAVHLSEERVFDCVWVFWAVDDLTPTTTYLHGYSSDVGKEVEEDPVVLSDRQSIVLVYT